MKKGEIDRRQKGNIKFTEWVDKRAVLMLTTREEYDNNLFDTGKVRKEIPIKKPKCVTDYNMAKKGVDYRYVCIRFNS